MNYKEYKLLTDNYVLIVPLWNWNETEADKGATAEGFNRTFMELKFVVFELRFAKILLF